MRRKDRQVKDLEVINTILSNNDICRVGLKDEEGLYIVPLNYGYQLNDDKLTLFFHSAKEGRKINTFEKGNVEVAFEIDEKNDIQGKEDLACSYTSFFKSIIGVGIASIIQEESERLFALDYLMKNVTQKENFKYEQKMLDRVHVLKIDVTSYSAKMH